MNRSIINQCVTARNTVLTLILICCFSMHSIAQQKDHTGIYYLSGVMETASGIKLNPDSTFEFFFSQGAVDRTGQGIWKQDGESLILNSDPPISPGFELKKSSFEKRKNILVEVESDNPVLYSFIHVSVTGTRQTDFTGLSSEGIAELKKTGLDTLYLYFELCPEKVHTIVPSAKQDNHFKIILNPSLFEVTLENIRLYIEDGYLKGGHPLLTGNNYNYVKD